MFYLVFCGYFSQGSTFLKGLFLHEAPKLIGDKTKVQIFSEYLNFKTSNDKPK